MFLLGGISMNRILLCLLMLLSVMSSTVSAQDDPVIVVGSKEFTENIVLGYIIYEALDAAGYNVVDRTRFGGSAEIRRGILAEEIDVYPEYTSTALANFFQDVEWIEITDELLRSAMDNYAYVSAMDAAVNDLVWLNAAPFNNIFAFAITSDFAVANELQTVSDFAAYVNNGGVVTLASNEEFATRRDGLVSFEVTYGFELLPYQTIVISGATPTQTSDALVRGAGDVNVAMVYTTNAMIIENDLVVLEDNLGSQPVFNIAPVFRGEVIRANPEIAGILNPIFESLDDETMQMLNRAVDVEGIDPQQVARDYLMEAGFVSR